MLEKPSESTHLAIVRGECFKDCRGWRAGDSARHSTCHHLPGVLGGEEQHEGEGEGEEE